MTYADLARQTGPLATSTEVARLLRVSQRTVLAWAQQGLIPSITTPGGQRRFEPDKVLATVEAARKELGP